jgi:hypothetical protein
MRNGSQCAMPIGMNSAFLLIIVLSAAAMPLRSQDMIFKSSGSKVSLVELYSSEGCSSCPPAEAWVSNLKSSPDLWKTLFPVVFHVDYWDGLGWPDRFAKAAFTERQRIYATRLGQDSVYTPEFIANGHEWRGWFEGAQNLQETETMGQLSLEAKSDGASISARFQPGSGAGSKAYTLNIALLGVNVLSDVKRGENRGRKLQHDFVVLDYQSKPLTSAQNYASGPVAFSPSAGDSPGAVVAWVSDSEGAIVQVAGGWLKNPSPAK